jgi:hypothetical protein
MLFEKLPRQLLPRSPYHTQLLQRHLVTVTNSEMMHIAIRPFSPRQLPLSLPATN